MKEPKRYGLWLLLVAQTICAAFFILDGVMDWAGSPDTMGFRHLHQFELFLSVVMGFSVVVTAMLIRNQAQQAKHLQRQLSVASGAFAQLIDAQFTEWELSPAERDVALLAIKGLSVAEMADLRQTREGTIKAQCAAVYRKAGVSGRLQLLSFFIEELIADPVVAPSDQHS